MKNFIVILTVGVMLGCVGMAEATTFTETVITGNNSILNSGVLVEANNLGFEAQSSTVNGVLFGNNGSSAISWNIGGGDFSTDAFSPELDNLLSNLLYENGRGNLTLNNLNVGSQYRLQLLFSNDLINNNTGNNIYVHLNNEQYLLDNWQYSAINLTVDFLAESSSVITSFSPGGDYPTGVAVINAYALHDITQPATVPEPSSMLLVGFGLAGLVWARRKKKK